MQLYVKEGTLNKNSVHDCGDETKCVSQFWQLPSAVVHKCQTT